MLVAISATLIWISFLSVIVIMATYMTQQWWKHRIGRFIVILKAALFIVYGSAVVRTIVSPQSLRIDTPTLISNGIVTMILMYGAYAFYKTVKDRN